MVDNVLGSRISAALKKSGRSQAQIAEAMGYSPQAITKWKKGIIGKQTLKELAGELGIDLTLLVYGDSFNGKNLALTSSQAQTLIETIQEMDAAGEMTPEELDSLNTYLTSRRKTKEQFKSGAGALIRKNAGQPPKSEGKD